MLVLLECGASWGVLGLGFCDEMELQMRGIGKVADEVNDCYMVRIVDENGYDNDDTVDENGCCNLGFTTAKD